jgi:hypothetical protein
MSIKESIPAPSDLKAFLEKAVDYIRTIDPETGRPVTGNREAKQGLNLCKSIRGILPFDSDIPYNISRIEKIIEYLDSLINNDRDLSELLSRAIGEFRLYREHAEGLEPLSLKVFRKREAEIPLSTKELLKGKYADFHDIYRDASKSVRSQLQGEVESEVFEDRLNRMKHKIEDEFTGGIDGLKIYFDAKHSELLYASQGGRAEAQRDFLSRAASTFIRACTKNTFYDLYTQIAPQTSEDVDSFVFRLAKKYTDIKVINPDAGIITYKNETGTIQLKTKGAA